MLVINQQQAAELLPMQACIDIMEKALADLTAGRAVQSLRQVVPLQGDNLLGIMPGYLPPEQVAGAKIISVFPGNRHRSLPSHQGLISLFDSASGRLLAIINGQAITAIRTAAASGAATRRLARQDASVLAILGTGEQARSHLEAMLLVRPIRTVHVWSPTLSHARRVREEMLAAHSSVYELDIHVAGNGEEAVRDADIICTVTSSTEPVLHGAWLKDGVHINAVGACRAHHRELDSEAVARSRLFVDRMESAVNEAGDYLLPLAEKAIAGDHIAGEIGAVFGGNVPGRQTAEDITLFKSLGLAVEDIAAAAYIYEEAIRRDKGWTIDF